MVKGSSGGKGEETCSVVFFRLLVPEKKEIASSPIEHHIVGLMGCRARFPEGVKRNFSVGICFCIF